MNNFTKQAEHDNTPCELSKEYYQREDETIRWIESHKWYQDLVRKIFIQIKREFTNNEDQMTFEGITNAWVNREAKEHDYPRHNLMYFEDSLSFDLCYLVQELEGNLVVDAYKIYLTLSGGKYLEDEKRVNVNTVEKYFQANVFRDLDCIINYQKIFGK